MKLASLTIVRDECDIIELFVKINIKELDHMYIIDHRSVDGTSLILEKLKESGHSIDIIQIDDADFNQAINMKKYLNKLAEKNIFDYFILLDADEFVISTEVGSSVRDVIKKHLKADEFAVAPWWTYIPIGVDYERRSAPLHSLFIRQAVETLQYYKAIAGREFARDCNVEEGNHSVENPRYPMPLRVLPLAIQHAPIRSPNQILRKTMRGKYVMSLKKTKSEFENWHWLHKYERLKAKSFKASVEDMIEMALAYGAPPTFPVNPELDPASAKIGTNDDVIEFKDLARINMLKLLDEYILELIARIRAANL